MISKAIGPLIRSVRAARWKLGHKDFLMVFNWHQVTPEFDPSRHHEATWTRLGHFELEIDYLAAKFQILALDEALDRLQRGRLKGACVSLTFDDGDISMADHVAPFLFRKKLPATFFINSAYLEGSHSYWFPVLNYFKSSTGPGQPGGLPFGLQEKAELLRRTDDPVFYNEVRMAVEQHARTIPNLNSRLVSPDWLSGLDGEQFAVGAHGHEHQRFSMMPADWQRNDLQKNIRTLSQFKAFRPIFAVPFGRESDWTNKTLEIARDFRLAVVLADGGVNTRPERNYRRIPSDGRKLRTLINATLARQKSVSQ